jgi:hypothetical protein
VSTTVEGRIRELGVVVEERWWTPVREDLVAKGLVLPEQQVETLHRAIGRVLSDFAWVVVGDLNATVEVAEEDHGLLCCFGFGTGSTGTWINPAWTEDQIAFELADGWSEEVSELPVARQRLTSNDGWPRCPGHDHAMELLHTDVEARWACPADRQRTWRRVGSLGDSASGG